MSQMNYRTWLLLLAVVGTAADQASKYGVFGWLNQNSPRYDPAQRTGACEMIPGAFELHVQYTEKPAGGSILRTVSSERMPHVNKGALFGFGNNSEGGANTLFAGVSVFAGLAIIGWSFRRSTAGDRLLCGALGLILAGTIGNLYDRLVFGGVRDFLHWYKLYDWPVFNIADCCLVCGAFLLLAHAFLTQPATAPEEASAASATLAAAPEVARMQ